MDSNINKNISPKKGRFNFVDVLILLAVLSLAAFFVYIFDPFGWMDVSQYDLADVTVKYQIEISGIDTEIANGIQIGDEIFDADKGEFLGTVSSIRMFDYAEEVQVGKKTEWHFVEGKSTVYIDVITQCVYQKDVGYIANGVLLVYNMKINVASPHFAATIRCTSVPEIK